MNAHILSVKPFAVTLEIEKVDIEFNDFQLNSTEGSVQVTRFLKDGRFVDVKTIDIPPDVYTTWGTDDNVIIDYVLQQLKMERFDPPILKKNSDTISTKPHKAQKR